MTTVSSSTSSSTTTASSAAASARTSLAGDYTNFLKLLTTQLQNQDPLSPMDTDKFTSQLVQYSQVEQQLATNTKLDTLAASSASASQAAAVNYLGAKIDLNNALTELTSSGATVTYKLASEATDVDLSFYNSDNKLVYTQVGKLAAGVNTVTWDGTLDDGTQAAAGTYRVAISAKDATGAAVSSTVDSSGTVTSVNFAADGVTLGVAGTTVPLSSVNTVSIPQS
ncbi:flagellar basal-body rod modification protein FlgD [Arboricoccus pini]|uniref:Basal-body rod modification protein FlgD n=1 Tax=Arboricoccus pini TaxID=1963835 RepID=A0A212RBK7_9PROT|nr:flagellar hook capping FlgD N-terminal domain-containing protein [Arboricoccus pini]SNB69597.1 flagellar basal-body rod modification protein FlgD [Arboricoccus pini]